MYYFSRGYILFFKWKLQFSVKNVNNSYLFLQVQVIDSRNERNRQKTFLIKMFYFAKSERRGSAFVCFSLIFFLLRHYIRIKWQNKYLNFHRLSCREFIRSFPLNIKLKTKKFLYQHFSFLYRHLITSEWKRTHIFFLLLTKPFFFHIHNFSTVLKWYCDISENCIMLQILTFFILIVKYWKFSRF